MFTFLHQEIRIKFSDREIIMFTFYTRKSESDNRKHGQNANNRIDSVPRCPDKDMQTDKISRQGVSSVLGSRMQKSLAFEGNGLQRGGNYFGRAAL